MLKKVLRYRRLCLVWGALVVSLWVVVILLLIFYILVVNYVYIDLPGLEKLSYQNIARTMARYHVG